MYNPLILPDLRVMLEENDTAGLAEFCEALHPAVAAEVFEGLEPANIWRVLSHCSVERQAEIFEFMSLPQQVPLVDVIDREHLSRLLERMAPDDRVDLLSRMDPDHVEHLLPLIAQAERSDIRKLLSYPEDSAGAIMTTEYASLPENITVREALERLRKQAPDSETIYYIYVLDEGRRVQGFVSLRQLILARPDAKLADIMTRDVITVRVDQDREIAAQELARFDFIAIPVVDSQNRLVGIVTHDDVLDVLQEEATEDVQRLGAVEPLEGSYLDTPLLTLTWKRGVWLVLLLFAALATAGVLKGYEEVSAEFDWMILFIPLVLASGGNAGSQSATLIIRMVALGETSAQTTLRVATRELMLACILGGGLATLGFVIALPLVAAQHAAVVAGTVFLVVVMGTVTGAMLPLAFKRLGMDPALMSNPLIAALVDVLGVIIYYNVALLVLT
ncbi:MAG TPA: magnesium transporter [Planctomycetaceae bacterium]|nr:magnesium transporter [Planctomycetaceae bacterium]